MLQHDKIKTELCLCITIVDNYLFFCLNTIDMHLTCHHTKSRTAAASLSLYSVQFSLSLAVSCHLFLFFLLLPLLCLHFHHFSFFILFSVLFSLSLSCLSWFLFGRLILPFCFLLSWPGIVRSSVHLYESLHIGKGVCNEVKSIASLGVC